MSSILTFSQNKKHKLNKILHTGPLNNYYLNLISAEATFRMCRQVLMMESVQMSHAAFMFSLHIKHRSRKSSWDGVWRAWGAGGGVSWPFYTDSLPAVEEEVAAAAAAGGGAPAELVREEEALSPTWVGLERVLAAAASLCWLTTEGCRRRAPGTGAWPVWKV